MNSYFLLIVYCATLVSVDGRGPHHPRGEPIAKRHVHYQPTKANEQKITQDEQLLHDKEHLKEHLDEVIDEPDLSKMSDEELEFYYFQVHDTDKNLKLDGLEILHAILHTTEHAASSNDTEGSDDSDLDSADKAQKDFEYYVELIDRVLLEDDLDKDGYLDYVEYSQGKKKATKIKPKSDEPVVQMIP